MLKNKHSFLLISLFCFLPLFSMAQLTNREGLHERGMMKNRTNVERESSDYQIGIIKDTVRFRNSLMRFIGSTTRDFDEGVEDEEDILRASTPLISSIHRKKTDFSHLNHPIYLPLTNYRVRKYYAFPCEGVRVTSHFGPRRARWHYGIDLGIRQGEPVKAMFDGKVRVARWSNGYGNLIVVEHDNKLETYYGHLSKIASYEGQPVKAGEVIGYSGNTGRSTGPHLHLEIRYEGAAINPEDVIDFNNFALLSNTLTLTRDNFIRQSSSYAVPSRVLAKSSYTKSSKKYAKAKSNSSTKQLAKNKIRKSKKHRR